MKKALVLLCMLAIVLSGATVFAGSIDYLTNQSAAYMMTFARTAATDDADIANYNPAGTVFMAQNGLYISGSVQYLIKPYEMEYMGETYEQSEPSIVPNLYAVYKADDWAAFFSFTIPAGGGSLKWDDGSATTAGLIAKTVATAKATGGGTGATTINSQSIEASSMYMGLTLGGAYKVNDMFSFSLAGRYIISQRSAKAAANFTADLVNDAAPGGVGVGSTTVDIESDYEYEAQGFGGIIGIDVRPMQGLTIGLRYETVTQLEYEYTMNERKATVTGEPAMVASATFQPGLISTLASLDKDGQKLRYDLPALLALGVQYTVMPGLDVMAGGVYYFLKQADMEGAEDNYDNGWEVSIGATYMVMPELKVGAGFNYTVSGVDPEYYANVENPNLDSWTVGLGAIYTAMPDLNITLAGSRTQYLTETKAGTTSATDVELKKVVWNFALGAQYRIAL